MPAPSASRPAIDVLVRPRGGDVGAALAAARAQHDVEVSARVGADGPIRGDWVAFLCEGDRWAPDRLARTIACAVDAGATWAYGAALAVDGRGRMRGLRLAEEPVTIAERLRVANVVGSASNAVIRRDAWEAAGGHDPRLAVLGDWELWIRLARAGLPAACPDPLVAELVDDPRVETLRRPRALLDDLEVLVARGAVADRRRPHAVGLSEDLEASGRRRAACGVLLRSAARHRTPQDLARAAAALRAPAPPADPVAYEPPAWLAAAA